MNGVSKGTVAQEIVIGFLLIDGFSLLSYAAAVEPLRAANTLAGRPLYKWMYISVDGKPVPASNGTLISSEYRVGQMPPINRLFVCAAGNPASFCHSQTFRWLKLLSQKGLPIGGISGGPYLLARAGILDGYRFTIHWEHLPAFTEDFPDLEPTRGLYAIDRDRLTCGGGLSALDMMHEMIKCDFGAPIANAVSRWFLQTEVRSGDRPQRLEAPARFAGSNSHLRKVFADIEANLEEPLSRQALATRAGCSMRQLDRIFCASLNMTVRAYYLTARLDRAQLLLLQTDMSVFDIGVACGFRSAGHFSRVYKSYFRRPPHLERRSRSATLLAVENA
jgi:transcriptional regulator GlxA family with amidase domain